MGFYMTLALYCTDLSWKCHQHVNGMSMIDQNVRKFWQHCDLCNINFWRFLILRVYKIMTQRKITFLLFVAFLKSLWGKKSTLHKRKTLSKVLVSYGSWQFETIFVENCTVLTEECFALVSTCNCRWWDFWFFLNSHYP